MTPTLIEAGPLLHLLEADEFVRLYPKHRVELVRGVVKEVPMPGGGHGHSSFRFAYDVGDHAMKNDLGRVFINDTFVVTDTDPDTVRGMDIAYASWSNLPRGPITRGALRVAPELVCEVHSPSDLWTELFAKVEEYLAIGVRVVVILAPAARVVSVIRDGSVQQDFGEAETLTLPDLPPGFAVPVHLLFD